MVFEWRWLWIIDNILCHLNALSISLISTLSYWSVSFPFTLIPLQQKIKSSWFVQCICSKWWRLDDMQDYGRTCSWNEFECTALPKHMSESRVYPMRVYQFDLLYFSNENAMSIDSWVLLRILVHDLLWC